jgi:AraC-like DNA-binding protein
VHPQTYRSLLHAREFMRHAYDRPINLREISARANLSPYRFLRVHQRAFRFTSGRSGRPRTSS